jgi:hypothetical protein
LIDAEPPHQAWTPAGTTNPRRTHKKSMKLRQKQKLMNKKHQVLKKQKRA